MVDYSGRTLETLTIAQFRVICSIMEQATHFCSPTELAKKEGELRKRLLEWAAEQVEAHDDPAITGIPKGTAGSVMDLGNPISSKRVLEASAITDDVIGHKIPPDLIAKGGYETAEAFVDQIMSGMSKVANGEIKIKAPKKKQMVVAS